MLATDVDGNESVDILQLTPDDLEAAAKALRDARMADPAAEILAVMLKDQNGTDVEIDWFVNGMEKS